MPVNINGGQPAPQAAPSAANPLLKKGSAAQQLVQQEEALIQQKKEANKDKVHRFFMPVGESRRITFLDGALTPDQAYFDVPAIREHNLRINGKWGNFFPCIAEQEPCPCCEEEQGGNAYVVAFFTVIDHTPHTYNGKTYENQVKLFAAKSSTMAILLRHALKPHINGLAGATFDVFRTGDKSASVGTEFEFVEKNDVAALCNHFTKVNNLKMGKPEDSDEYRVQPINYEKAIQYLSGAQLRQMGIGGYVPGQEMSVSQAPSMPTPSGTMVSSMVPEMPTGGIMGGAPAPQNIPAGGVMGGAPVAPQTSPEGGGIMGGAPQAPVSPAGGVMGGNPAPAGVDANLADQL